jgi:mRNA (guanine-N7-)-methyltransferase
VVPASKRPKTAVAIHYNERKQETVAQRSTSSSIYIRSFNNWIKIVLLNETVRKISLEEFDKHEKKGRYEDYYENVTVDTLYAKEEELKNISKHLGLYVMDMACGQGGDLSKWGYLDVRDYVGFDIADEAVNRAKDRYRKAKRPFQFSADFVTHDLGNPIPRLPHLKPHSRDIVSMQFALHYFFESASKLRQLLENVNQYLAPGGYFVGTTTDFKIIKERMKEAKDQLSFGNDYYQVSYAEDVRDLVLSQPEPWEVIMNQYPSSSSTSPPPPLPEFGLSYTFSLTDAVKELPEFIVQKEVMDKYAGLHNLIPCEWKNFHKYYYNNANQHMPLFQKMVGYEGSSDEWHTSEVYCVFVYKKLGE